MIDRMLTVGGFTLLSRITHVTSRPDRTFLVGVEFTSELNPEELRLLLA